MRATRGLLARLLLATALILTAGWPVVASGHEDKGGPPKRGHPQPPDPPDPPTPKTRRMRVNLKGQIRDLPDDTSLIGVWTVVDSVGAEWAVEVTAETKITPPSAQPAEDDWVHLTGWAEESEHTLVADHVNVEQGGEQRARPVEIKGEIELLPDTADLTGEWVVDDVAFTVDERTMIHPDRVTPEVGMLANVSAFQQADTTLWAKNIALHPVEEPEVEEVKFEGPIESLPSGSLVGTWVVKGIKVTVVSDTELRGMRPAVGLWAEVRGEPKEDGSVLARRIMVEGAEHDEIEFRGVIEALPESGLLGTWVVGGINVTVTSDTELKGTLIAVGLWAKVEGVLQGDGSVLASRIRVEGAGNNGGPPWGLGPKNSIWRIETQWMSETM